MRTARFAILLIILAIPLAAYAGKGGGGSTINGRGSLDGISCLTDYATGWAQDTDTPTSPVSVYFWIDDTPDSSTSDAGSVGSIGANEYRSDLCSSIGSCEHGYSWAIPSQYLDHQTHTLHAYGKDTASNEGAELSNSPKNFSCYPPPSCSVTFDKSPVSYGESTTMRWVSNLASTMYITGVGYVTPNIVGSASVTGGGTSSNCVSTGQAQSITVYLTGGTSWTVPSDWNSTSNTIEVIGAGGGGKTGSSQRPGGGGGAYAKISNMSLTAGASVTYQVGTGGAAGAAGQDTFFNRTSGSATTCSSGTMSACAKGGSAGSGTTGGAGGTSGGSVGTVKYSGGAGGSADSNSAGGGGAAGPGGAGKAGGNSNSTSQQQGKVWVTTPGGFAGGGGAGGGSATVGQSANGTSSGVAGGSGPSGGGGGAGGGAGAAGTIGGGGGGGNNTLGGTGGLGTEWNATHGAGGGAGGGYTAGGSGGLYGGGGGGGTSGTNGSANAGNGAQGIVVITYTPVGAPPSCYINVDYSCAVQGTDTSRTYAYALLVAPPPAPTVTISVSSSTVGVGSPTEVTATFSGAAVDPLTGTNIDYPAGTHLAATSTPSSPKTAFFTPSATGTFSLLARVLSGYYSSWTTLASTTVTAITPPSCSVTFDTNPIPQGSSTTVHWTSSASTEFSLATIGSVTPNTTGSASVSASQATDYTGSASKSGVTTQCAAILSVSCTAGYTCSGTQTIVHTNADCTTTTSSCTAPLFCSTGSAVCLNPTPTFIQSAGLSGHLQVKPQVLKSGTQTTVTWNVGNVQSCSVSGDNTDSWTGTSGSHLSLPIRQQTNYTLSCLGLDDSTLHERVTVNILPTFQER